MLWNFKEFYEKVLKSGEINLLDLPSHLGFQNRNLFQTIETG